MDYVTITPEQVTDFKRRVLLQAESDHLRATLQEAAARTLLADAAPGSEQEAALAATIKQLGEQAISAEATATSAKEALDAAGEEYVAPVVPVDVDRTPLTPPTLTPADAPTLTPAEDLTGP